MLTTEKQLIAIEHAFDGIALLDSSGSYLYMNKAHAELFGYDTGDELMGKSWKFIYTPENADRLEREVFPVLMKKGNWSGETIGVSKQGAPVIQYISLTSLPDGGLVCVCRDYSSNINSNRLHYLMSNLGKGILVEDENHRVVMVNHQFCNFFQIPLEPEQMVGADCLQALDQSLHLFKNPPAVKEDIVHMVGKRESLIGQEVEFADGRIFERDYVPIMIENTFKGQLWSYSDITPNRQLQKSLVDAKNKAIASEKTKSAFLSNMSHEIRTPMNAILGLAEQLEFSELNERQAYFVKNISDSAKSLLGVINDILDMSKIEAGKMTIEKENVNIHNINQSVINILRPKAEEKGLALETHINKEILPRLVSDEVRLRQILMNVLSNAIKFTEQGFVKLSISLISKSNNTQLVEFECEDSGIGISKESIGYIFDEFYQENNSNTARNRGSGLGLAITKTLVGLMGGEIKIESVQNLGTKVIIRIPFEISTENEIPAEQIGEENLECIRGKRILLVEDNKLNRILFNMMLTNLCITHDEAEHGLEALDKIEHNTYDLVLMDIQMPVMDGITALHHIKKKYGNALPVVALTAAAFKSEVSHMLNLGFVDCITKPIDQKNLAHRLCLLFNNEYNKGKYFSNIENQIDVAISEMANHDAAQKAKLFDYMLEEVNAAIDEWGRSMPLKDWSMARKTLHREKVMINSLGLKTYDGIISEIEDDTLVKSDAEMTLMFTQVVDLFKNIRESFEIKKSKLPA
jgi:PAS domain S-box-containing protein